MEKYTTVTLPSGMILDIIEGKGLHFFKAMYKHDRASEDQKETGILPFLIQQLCLKDSKQMDIDFILDMTIDDSCYIITVLNIQLQKLNL